MLATIHDHLFLTLIHHTQLTEKMIELVRINILDILLEEATLDQKAWQGLVSKQGNLYEKWLKPLKADLDLYGIDILLHTQEQYNPKLIVFDMDSTLINSEVIDELAQEANAFNAVQEITTQAMSGKLDFKASLLARLKHLENLPVAALDKAYNRILLNTGAVTLFNTLKIHHTKTAILSGGFTWFAKKIQKKLGIDHIVANELEIKNNQLTGHLIGPIIDSAMKQKKLIELSKKYDIPLYQTMAVGDGANDIPMLQTAGTGIAFHAKPIVQNTTQFALNHNDLDALKYMFDYH
ncbi:MAG: phosphoserine phosphatase SerB [Endozoicomonadaceae bacterium]|nr:phosphoserine phosphatase SerB [Endozoicomonadaceae bacterium]